MAEEHDHTYTLKADFDRLIAGLRELTDGFGDVEKAGAKTEKQISAAERRLAAAGKQVAATVSGMALLTTAAVAAGAGFKDLADDIANAYQEMSQLESTSGLTIDAINNLRTAARLAGAELDGIVPDDLGERMLDVLEGGNDTAKAFGRLGVEVTDAQGKLRNADDVLSEVVGKLQAIDHDGQRAGLATLALGENAGRLMATLGDRRLEDFVDLSREFGYDTGPEARDQIAAWAEANGRLGIAFDSLKQDLFDAFGPAATEAIHTTASALIFAGSQVDVFKSRLEGISKLYVGIQAGLVDWRLGGDLVAEGWAILNDEVNDTATAYEEAARRVEEFWIAAQGDFTGPTPDMVEDQPDPNDDPEKAEKARLKRVQEIAAAQERMADIARTANDSNLEGVDAINAAYREQMLLIYELAKAGASSSEAIQAVEEARENAIAALYDERLEKAAETNEKIADDAEKAFEDAYDAVEGVLDDIKDAFKERREEIQAGWEELGAAVASSFEDAAQGFGDLIAMQMEKTLSLRDSEGEVLEERADRIKELRDLAREAELAGNRERASELRAQADRLKGRQAETRSAIEGYQEQLDKQHRAAVAAFRVQQALSIASIVASSAELGVKLAAALAPALNIAAIPVAAGLAAASAAGQIASVTSQSPPPAPESILHDGGLLLAPDEYRFGGSVVRRGEAAAMLNQRAVESGGLEVVDAVNRGTLGGGGSSVLRIEQGGIVLGEAIVTVLEEDSPTSRRLRASIAAAAQTQALA